MTPKTFIRQLCSLSPLKYRSFAEVWPDRVSLLEEQHSGVGRRVGVREFLSPNEISERLIFASIRDADDILRDDDDGRFIFAAPLAASANDVALNLAQRTGPTMMLLPRSVLMEERPKFSVLTVLERGRWFGEHIAVNYLPPLAYEKIQHLRFGVVQSGGRSWRRPQRRNQRKQRRHIQHEALLDNVQRLPDDQRRRFRNGGNDD